MMIMMRNKKNTTTRSTGLDIQRLPTCRGKMFKPRCRTFSFLLFKQILRFVQIDLRYTGPCNTYRLANQKNQTEDQLFQHQTIAPSFSSSSLALLNILLYLCCCCFITPLHLAYNLEERIHLYILYCMIYLQWFYS